MGILSFEQDGRVAEKAQAGAHAEAIDHPQEGGAESREHGRYESELKESESIVCSPRIF